MATDDFVAMVLALLLTPAAGCGSPAAPAPGVDQTVSLHVGQRASVSDNALQLQFDGVASDSRCPSDVQCVRAGEAEVKVTVASRGKTESYSLFVGASPTSADYEDFTIELLRLEPYPKESRPTARDEYVATFRVRTRT